MELFDHPAPLKTVAVIAADVLDPAWHDGRVDLPLNVHRGETLFGAPLGGAMTYSFGDLIAHAAATRDLCAGAVIGSGTVSNFDAKTAGSGCIAERRALDALDTGRPATPYLRFGERVRLETLDSEGASVFGDLDQCVVQRNG